MSGLPSWARKGQHVVCVDDTWLGGPAPITKGAVYVIESVVAYRPPGRAIGPYAKTPHSLRLVCIHNNISYAGGFAVERFRPAVPPRTMAEDVRKFKHLLVPKQGTVDA